MSLTAVTEDGAMSSAATLRAYELHMRTAQLSPETIKHRMELLWRLSGWLQPVTLLAATSRDLERFQQLFVHLSRATIDIYSRHVVALYRWAVQYEYLPTDPTSRMVKIRVRQGMPHPITSGDLRLVLACSLGALRMAYILAAFAGLRRGEICRLRGEDLHLDAAQPVAMIDGKGRRERVVPLLPPVVDALRAAGFPRTGYVVPGDGGGPYDLEKLSLESYHFMRSVGVESTLHSCRHYFATEVVKLTKDILLVRDLLGHSSVHTTQIYMNSSIDGAADRLAGLSGTAASMMANTDETRSVTGLEPETGHG
jgi:integrase/recombinase XerD